MKRRNALILYLVLNVIVSAATTLTVLTLWDRARQRDLPTGDLPTSAGVVQAADVTQPAPVTPQPTETLPPVDQPVIQIVSVVGAGDLEYEVVILKRLGDGNLRMAGWRLEPDGGARYVFPEQPELVLYKDGAVQVYTKTGADTAAEVYWNRPEPAWKPGDTIRVIDAQGNERAIYRVP